MKKSLFIFQILCLLIIFGCSRSSKKNNEALHSLRINYNNEYATVNNNNHKEKYNTGERVVLQVEAKSGFELNSVESEANLKRNNNIIEIEIVGDTEITLLFVKSAIETDGIFNYQYSTGEGYFIVKYLGEAREINIPSEFQGNEDIKKVVGIGDEVFASKMIKELNLGNFIESIGIKAFYNNEIRKIIFPSTLKKIDVDSFAKNYLQNVQAEDEIKKILCKEKHFAQNNNLDNNLKKRFELKLLENNTWELSKYLSEEKNVNIPKEIHGVKVSGIGIESFEGKYITGININEGIEKIEEKAFFNNNLSHVYIPDSIKHIGDDAFSGNGDLTIYTNNPVGKNYAENNSNIILKDSENTDFIIELFNDGKYRIIAYKGEEKELIIPEKINGIPVGHIGESAFERKGLETLKIKANLESIAKDAFAYNHLNKVEAVEATKKILDKNEHFKGNNNLDNSLKQKFKLEEYQGGYKIKEYLSKEKESVVVNRYINGREVQSIGERAFEDKSIKNLILESIYKIEESAFENNELDILIIPSVLQKIGDSAFKNAFSRDNTYNFVNIPQGLREIGKDAFKDNSTVVFLGDNTKAMEYAEQHDYILSFYDANTATKGEDIIDLYRVEHWADGYGIRSYLGTSRDIVIPKTLNGRPVYYIGEGAFAGRGLRSLIIPEGSKIEWIGANAFTRNNLREVVLSTDILVVEPMSILAYEETIKDYARLLAFVSKSMYRSFGNKESLEFALNYLLREKSEVEFPDLKTIKEVLKPIRLMIPENLIVDFIKKIVDSPYIRNKILELGKDKTGEKLGALEVLIIEKLVEVLADLKNSSFDEDVRKIRRLGANYFETESHNINGTSGLKITKYNTNHKIYRDFYYEHIFDDFIKGKNYGLGSAGASVELLAAFNEFKGKIEVLEKRVEENDYLTKDDFKEAKAYLKNTINMLKKNSISKDFIDKIPEIKKAMFAFIEIQKNIETKYFRDIEIPSEINGEKVIAIGNNVFDRSQTETIYKEALNNLFTRAIRGTVEGNIKRQLLTPKIDPEELEVVIKGYKFGTLTSVRFPKHLISIGNEAFKGNTLVYVQLPKKLLSVGERAFVDNPIQILKLNNSLKRIEKEAFIRVPIKEIKFPSSIEYIGESSFRDNSRMEKIEFESFKESYENNFIIGDYAFRDNIRDGDIYIPDNLQSLGKEAFYFTGYGLGRIRAHVRFNTLGHSALKNYTDGIGIPNHLQINKYNE